MKERRNTPYNRFSLYGLSERLRSARFLLSPEVLPASWLRWLGAVGTILIAAGGLGAGALPVVDNPWFRFPGGDVMGRMLITSSAVAFVGVGLLVVAWLLLGAHVGVFSGRSSLSKSSLMRTYLVWIAPIICTAPMFTQDIYSYFAQGSILRQGMDPYEAGPVEMLGPDNPLARSVPFIWAHSPSPYGPVALGLNAAISGLTGDAALSGVILHRLVGIAALMAGAWATTNLAQRCGVEPVAALWLGIVNPLAILHLVAGIHNEALMLGLILVGMELGLRGVDAVSGASGGRLSNPRGWGLLVMSGVLLSCAGLVQVTGFIALGFTGMALARALHRRVAAVPAILAAGFFQALLLAATTVVTSVASGAGFGWITSQGGAAQIRSVYSLTTNVGVAAGQVGMRLGLGDHTDAMLTLTRGVGVAVAMLFIIRVLWETFTGRIHPVGGLGVGSLVLVFLFPVIQPWYCLWAFLPLAAWAKRKSLRTAVVVISALFSFVVLPRGLALPSETVATIYASAFLALAVLGAAGWSLLKRHARRQFQPSSELVRINPHG